MAGSNDGVAEFHARRIRDAIAIAEADGYTVDFGWGVWGQASSVRLAIVHSDRNWKEAIRIWPTK